MNTSKIPVTVLILTKNEEAGIRDCLNRLDAFDEIIVVDSASEDQTKEIAEKCGAQTVDFVWNGKYPKKKQWMLENVPATHSWILYLDADETPSEELVEQLETLDFSTLEGVAAFDIPLEYVFAGHTLKHGHTVVKRALLHRDRVMFPEVGDLNAPGIGEVEGHYQPIIRESRYLVNRLEGRIRHDDKDPIRSWFDRHNKYSDWEAYLCVNPETKKNIAVARSFQGRIFDKVPFKPLAFFGYSYLLKRGYKDGQAGFDYAFALSTYYWQIGIKTRELKRNMAQLGRG